MDFIKPKIIISKCLEFDACRYDGQIINNKYIKKLKKFIDFNTICPEVEIGMGIHGEPGIKREKLRPANDLVDDLYKRIIEDSKLTSDDNIAVMINSLGATPLEELYIISKRVNENLINSKIKNIKTYVGRYATSMEMAGMSITTLKLNDNLKKYLFAESKCPFWNN